MAMPLYVFSSGHALEIALKTSVSHGSVRAMLAMRGWESDASVVAASCCAASEHDQTDHVLVCCASHENLMSGEGGIVGAGSIHSG